MESRIEFIKGEDYCRFDGRLMSPEGCQELYGYSGRIDAYNGFVIMEGRTIYTDLTLGKVLCSLGRVTREVKDYDPIPNQGYGFSSAIHEKRLENTVLLRLNEVELLENIKPMSELLVDYPKLDLDKYKDFMDELTDYYEFYDTNLKEE